MMANGRGLEFKPGAFPAGGDYEAVLLDGECVGAIERVSDGWRSAGFRKAVSTRAEAVRKLLLSRAVRLRRRADVLEGAARAIK
jgi:hypothetical protein